MFITLLAYTDLLTPNIHVKLLRPFQQLKAFLLDHRIMGECQVFDPRLTHLCFTGAPIAHGSGLSMRADYTIYSQRTHVMLNYGCNSNSLPDNSYENRGEPYGVVLKADG